MHFAPHALQHLALGLYTLFYARSRGAKLGKPMEQVPAEDPTNLV
jgi:hypothetical protein